MRDFDVFSNFARHHLVNCLKMIIRENMLHITCWLKTTQIFKDSFALLSDQSLSKIIYFVFAGYHVQYVIRIRRSQTNITFLQKPFFVYIIRKFIKLTEIKKKMATLPECGNILIFLSNQFQGFQNSKICNLNTFRGAEFGFL